MSKKIPETINVFGYEKTLYDFSEFGIRGLSEPFVISNESEKPTRRMANINFGIFGGAVRSINFLVGEFYETPGFDTSRVIVRNYTLGSFPVSSPVFALPKEIVSCVLRENCKTYRIEGPKSPGLKLLDILASTTIRKTDLADLEKRLPLLLSWCKDTGASRLEAKQLPENKSVNVFWQDKFEALGFVPTGFSLKDLVAFIVSTGKLPTKEHLKHFSRSKTVQELLHE